MLTDMGKQILDNAPMFLHKKLENSLSSMTNEDRERILKSIQILISSIEAEDVDSSPILASGESIVGEPEVTINEDGEFRHKE